MKVEEYIRKYPIGRLLIRSRAVLFVIAKRRTNDEGKV